MATATALLAFGSAAVGYAFIDQQQAPQLDATAAGSLGSSFSPARTPSPPLAAATPSPATGLTALASSVLSPSPPLRIRIPAIDVSSSLIDLGLNPDGTLQVPQPGRDYDRAAWYKYSATPGEVGTSVIEGHVDSAANGPSVFFELGALRPGDQVKVDRQDGTVAVFGITGVRKYAKDQFPTQQVYGATGRPALRLITCGGSFDRTTGNYRDDIVVYAELTGVNQ